MSLEADRCARMDTTTTPCVGDTMMLALLTPDDFEAAGNTIIDFDNFMTFDDYLSDREGFAIGLSSAGQDTRLVLVSLRAFEAWSLRAGLQPTVANLDVFATILHDLRRAGQMPGAERERDDAGDPATPWGGENLTPTVSRYVEMYMNWLECLSAVPICPTPPSPRIYARLLMESWAECL